MTRQLAYGTVRDHPRKVIHIVRVLDEILDYLEIDHVTEQMRIHVISRYGEQTPNIVLVQGDSKEDLRLFGESHAVARVRAALFNAAVGWSPLQLDEIG
ncbi:MAG TPA: hypothetical protein VEQ86_09640 [Xanthobacteraceae bacterium]|jgi:hypothetical protein|nr:hypothetical protein [Xanthobacteraceae bacterium]